MKKQILAGLLTTAMMMGLTACSSSATASTTAAATTAGTATEAATTTGSTTAAAETTKASKPANRLEEIKARGYIEVATEPYFAPNEFIDSSKTGDEQYVGSDIELAKLIAERLGVELKIVPLEFSAVTSSVIDGKYDLAISALAYTPTRAEAMNMSKAYYINPNSEGYGLLVREEDVDKYPDIASLEDAVLVCQSGSLQEMFVNEQVEKCKEVKKVSATTDGFLMVSENKADGCVTAIATARLYASQNPGVTIANGVRFIQDERTAGTRIGIKKGEDELTDFINEICDEMMSSGTYQEWYDEYTEYASKLGVK